MQKALAIRIRVPAQNKVEAHADGESKRQANALLGRQGHKPLLIQIEAQVPH